MTLNEEKGEQLKKQEKALQSYSEASSKVASKIQWLEKIQSDNNVAIFKDAQSIQKDLESF